MASTLSDLGFDVIRRTNATKQVMESAILDFWRQLGVYLFKAIGTYDSFIELYNPDSYTQQGLGPTENGFGLVLNF